MRWFTRMWQAGAVTMLKNHSNDLLYAYLTAAFVFAVTAIFSTGYHNADEYLNVIDVIMSRLRPWQAVDTPPGMEAGQTAGLLPMLAFGFLKAMDEIGITSPFTQSILLRMGTGFFCLAVSFVGLKAFLPAIKEERLIQPMIYLTPLLWFTPYICVRFSPETLSGAVFFLGVAIGLLKNSGEEKAWYTRIPWWAVGLLHGIAFDLKYLTGVMMLGWLIWLIIIGRERWLNVVLMFLGGMAGIALGVLADRWLYGSWHWSFLERLSLGSGGFFNQPWWYWLQEIFYNGGFVVGICLIFCLFYFWVRFFRSPITWITIPLLLVCLFISRKDIRHLFPLSFVMTFMIMYSTQDLIMLARKGLATWLRRGIYYSITFLFLVANCAFLCLFAFKTADMDTDALHFIDRQYRTRDIILLYHESSNPYFYYDFGNRKRAFFYPTDLEMHQVNSAADITPYLQRKDKMVVLVVRQKVLDAGFSINRNQFIKVYESLSPLYFRLTANQWEQQQNALLVYQPISCRLVF